MSPRKLLLGENWKKKKTQIGLVPDRNGRECLIRQYYSVDGRYSESGKAVGKYGVDTVYMI